MKTDRHSGIVTESEAAAILRGGGVVGMPTETVYGLAASAFDELAVARIFEVKSRPRFDPLIVHIAEPEELGLLAAMVPPSALRLAGKFWPGPLTMVLAKRDSVPDLVTAGQNSVAVRLPSHPVARSLIRQAGVPLAAPSANRFGGISPTRAADVLAALGDGIDGVVDGGACAVGIESTIVAFLDGPPRLLRPGGIEREAIESCIGPLTDPTGQAGEVAVPGSMLRHYAPATPLYYGPAASAGSFAGRRVGRLVFGPGGEATAGAFTLNLDPGGDLRVAAANLYRFLRRLDAAGLDLIAADLLPAKGLGVAINDRLRRAGKPCPARPAGAAGQKDPSDPADWRVR